jgi:serine/threonine protein kinase
MTMVEFTGDSGERWQYDEADRLDEADPGSSSRIYGGQGRDGNPVAVKALPGVFAFAPGILLRERQIADHLRGTDSVHLIQTLDTARLGDDLLLVQERAERSLADHLREHGPFSEEEAARVLREIAAGLRDLHQAAVIHRDVKPSNILLHEGQWKLADFGIARDAEIGTQSPTWMGLGTQPYMAPETWHGRPPSFKTDLYSLGCVGSELLSGDKLNPGPSENDYYRQHTQEERVLPDVQLRGLDRLLRRLLMKDPAGRPQDARDVVETLSLILDPRPTDSQRLQELANQHASELSAIDAKTARENQEAERIRALIRQSGEDLAGVLGVAADMIDDQIGETVYRWDASSPEISNPLATVVVRNLRPFGSNDPGDTAVAVGAVMLLNRRGTSYMLAADLLYEEVEPGRYGWNVYRFRNRAGVAQGHPNRPGEHGIGPEAMMADRRGIRGNVMLPFQWGIELLTPAVAQKLFEEALALPAQD